MLFHLGDKDHLITVSHRLIAAGMATVGTAVAAVIALISSVLYPGAVAVVATAGVSVACLVLWVGLPLLRRRHDLGD